MRGLDPGTLAAIYGELEEVLDTVPGLRVGKWGNSVNVPAALISLPQSIDRMTGGTIKLTDVVITVVVGRAVARESLSEIMRLTGAVSETLDPHDWQTLSDLTISHIEYDTVTINGASEAFLAALFHTDIAGA